jgi:ketosteroid isomerase-like protein
MTDETAMTDDALATVHAYLDAFNAGDIDAMANLFAEQGSILDGMAPHLWTGPTAVRDWYRDVMTESAHVGASGYHVTLGDAVHNAVSGASAYVVVPATMTFYRDGEPRTQAGSFFTVALRQQAEGWRVAGWSWTKGTG